MDTRLAVFFMVAVVLFGVKLPSANSCPTFCKCYHRYPFDVGTDREYLLDSSWMYYSYYSSSMHNRLYIAGCSNANLTEIPIGVDTDVKTIALNNNSLTHLRNKAFEIVGLTDLLIIYLNNNSISLIEENAFSGLIYLRKLVLDDNNITTLPENVFEPCINLRHLSMNGNKFISLESNFIHNLDSLQVLELADCNLKSLPSEFYTKQFTFLDISNNDLQNVTLNFPTQILNISNNNGIYFTPEANLDSLTILNLSDSKLIHSQHTHFKAPNLEILILNSCNITDEDFDFLVQNNSKIKILEFMENKLQQLPISSAQSLTSLQEAYLKKNNIRSLEQNLFANSLSLIKIDLSENPLNLNHTRAILNSSSLEVMILQSCNITKFNEHTFSLTLKLVELYLDNNLIEYIDEAFHELHLLRILSLEGNRIKEIHPYSFVNNVQLKSLSLSKNPLEIPAASYLLSAPVLIEIRLNSCNITHIPAKMFANMPYLQAIRLANNSITTLDPEVFDRLTKLFAVDLGGNPLICDGHLKKVFHVLLEKHIISRAQCATPKGDWRMLEHMHFDEVNRSSVVIHSTSSTPESTSVISAVSSRVIAPQKEGLSAAVMSILLIVGLLVGVLAGIALDIFLSRRTKWFSLRRSSNWKRIIFDRNST